MNNSNNNFKNTALKINDILEEMKLVVEIIEKDGAANSVKKLGQLVDNILDVEEMSYSIGVDFKNVIDESCFNINLNLEEIYKEFELLNEKQILRKIKEDLTQNITLLIEKLMLIDKIKQFPFWYHKIELPMGIITPGWAPLNSEMYKIPEDMTGLRVLDVGSWDGYWAFEALKRGAKQVVAIDDFSDFLGKLENHHRKAWETFDLCKKVLRYTDEQCQRYDMSVYDINEESIGRFDAIFFFGVLYHLRYPLLALDKVSSICDGEIYVETAILDDFSVFNGGFGKGYSRNQVVAEFYSGSQYGENNTNWWVPSLSCLEHMLVAAEFKDIDSWKLRNNPNQLSECRGFAHGTKKSIIKETVDMDKTKSQLGRKPMNSKYYIETSMDDRNIIRVVNEDKKIYIGSKYSVERDINKFNESLNNINGNTVIIVFGISCGEHIKELLKNLGDANKIIIIEPSEEIGNLFLNMEYSTDILQDKRVESYNYNSQNIEEILSENIQDYQVDNIKVISFANYSDIFEGEFKGLNKALRKISMNKRIGRDTIAFFSQSLFQNFIKNLKNSTGHAVINSYKDVFKGKPAIIVSAGPSLEKNIHLLKEAGHKFVIICGARTLKALTNIGVTPDFVCAVDPQDITYTIMKNELNCKVPLVFMESANYKLVNEYKGPKILFSNEGMETYIESITGKQVDSLMQGGSVAHVCMGLAYYIGCNPIVFIGQDLAYTGDKFHAQSTKAMENPGDVAVTEYEKNKEQWKNMIGQNIYVKDINGDLVRTSIMLNSYREEFEDLIEECQEETFINSTEGGAHINGTEVISLKKAIEKYAKGEFDKNIDFTDTIKEDILKENFIIIKDNLMHMKTACKKGIVYADKMYLHYITPKKTNVNKIFGELDKVDLVINDMKKIGVIAYLLAPYVETILNDEKYVEKLNESQTQTGKRVAKKTKALYEVILKAIDEALEYIDSAN